MYGIVGRALLIGDFVVGTKVFGSRRWIPLGGGFQFQVSEFVKLVIVLLVARYLTELKTDDLDWRDLLKMAGLVGIADAAGDEAARSGDVSDLRADSGRRVFLAGLRWQVSGGRLC